MSQWYYSRSGVQRGPVEEAELVALARRGELKPDDFVWRAEYGQQWKRAGTDERFFPPGLPGAASASALASLSRGHGGSDSPTSMPANREITAAARAALRGRWGLAVGFTVLYAALVMAVSAAGAFVGAALPLAQLAIAWVAMPCLMAGVMMFFLAVARGGRPDFAHMFGGFARIGTAVGAYVLSAVFTLLWLLMALLPLVVFVAVFFGVNQTVPPSNPHLWGVGMKTAFVSGVVYYAIAATAISLRYSLVFLAVADGDRPGPLESVGRSVRLMKGRKLQFLFLALRFFGWVLLALLTCGIGLLWVFPYYTTAVAVFYDRAESVGRI